MTLDQDLELYRADEPALGNPYALSPGLLQEDYGHAPLHSSVGAQPLGLLSAVMAAPKSGEEAAAFMRAAHAGTWAWRGLCLSLQRQARGLPAVYPSAFAAAAATPKSERVTKLADLRRGMIAYSDDPNDSNPHGHIYYIAGRDKEGTVLTWTNDALRSGGVDMVPIDFYKANWGDTFQFGATWLNGYSFADFDKPPEPAPGRDKLGANFEHAIDDIEKALAYHRKKGNGRLAKILKRDVKILRQQAAKFGVNS